MTSFKIQVGSNTRLAYWHDSSQLHIAAFQSNTLLPYPGNRDIRDVGIFV